MSGDPFIYNLLKQYINGYVFYINQGPERRLIKFEDKLQRQTWLLTEITTWNDFKKKHIK
jgi:hypothetical protein